jgi:hypothetical protein
LIRTIQSKYACRGYEAGVVQQSSRVMCCGLATTALVAHVAVAQLASYLDRSRDAPPRTTVIWLGFERLRTLVRGFDMANLSENTKLVGNGKPRRRFAIDAGTLDNRDLVLSAPCITATGADKVGIGTRTFDYRLMPSALASSDGTGGITVQLLITDPWAKPKFRLDPDSPAQERLKAEAQDAEARAKAALGAMTATELGTLHQDDESMEPAAKRRAHVAQ